MPNSERLNHKINEETSRCRIHRENIRCRAVGRRARAGGRVAARAAETYPAHNVTAIIPFAAGNANDITARIVFEQLQKQLGQPIVIEQAGRRRHHRRRSGRARHAGRLHHPVPFGLVQLGLCDAQDAALRHVQGFHRGRAGRHFAERARCSPSKGYKTAADLVAAAKAKPGALNFASAGIGAASHLAAEKFNVAAGIKSQHVPFKGPVEALTEVMAGRIDYYFLPIAPRSR